MCLMCLMCLMWTHVWRVVTKRQWYALECLLLWLKYITRATPPVSCVRPVFTASFKYERAKNKKKLWRSFPFANRPMWVSVCGVPVNMCWWVSVWHMQRSTIASFWAIKCVLSFAESVKGPGKQLQTPMLRAASCSCFCSCSATGSTLNMRRCVCAVYRYMRCTGNKF